MADLPYVMRGWLPIATADKDISVAMELGPVTLIHSYPIWVRSRDGAPRMASWCLKEKGSTDGYWWDWDAEDVIDPDEWLPHPLRFPASPCPVSLEEIVGVLEPFSKLADSMEKTASEAACNAGTVVGPARYEDCVRIRSLLHRLKGEANE